MVIEREFDSGVTQAMADDPRWNEAARAHDWRNHVGAGARALWVTFTPEQRLELARDAEELAREEVWTR